MAEPERTDDGTDRLLVDAMCGTLATYLRMCGHDAAYALDRGVEDDDALLALARTEDRRLVTRDRALGRRAEGAISLTARDVREQLRTVADAGFHLELPAEPRRCSACNGVLERVRPDASTPADAPDPAETAVWRCDDCGQHFWRGSHWDDVAGTLADL